MFGHSPIAASPFGALGDSTSVVSLVGIASTSAIGDLTTAYHVTASGVSEADGIGDLSTGYYATLSGVTDPGGIGSLAISYIVSAAGVVEADGIGGLSLSYTIHPGGLASSLAIGDLSTSVIIAPTSVVAWTPHGSNEPDRFGLAAIAPGQVIVAGVGEFEEGETVSDAVVGTPSVLYVIRGLSMGSEVAIGSMSLTGDQTLSFSGAERWGRSFPGIAEITDSPGFRPFQNGESEVLPFGGVMAWKASTGSAAARTLAQKPTATNLYNIAGGVAGMSAEGQNVGAEALGFLYVRGMAQVRVIGHASLTAGSVVEAVAGQYYLQYASSQSAVNQFVIHEDHTSVGTVALKMVNVKVAI